VGVCSSVLLIPAISGCGRKKPPLISLSEFADPAQQYADGVFRAAYDGAVAITSESRVSVFIYLPLSSLESAAIEATE
jgi:hypothetical protein